jgi:hypothetical protein
MPNLNDSEKIEEFLKTARERGRPHVPATPEELTAMVKNPCDIENKLVLEIRQGDSSGYYSPAKKLGEWNLISIGPVDWNSGLPIGKWFDRQPRGGQPNPDNWISARFCEGTSFGYKPKSEMACEVEAGDFIYGRLDNRKAFLALCVSSSTDGRPVEIVEKPGTPPIAADDLLEVIEWGKIANRQQECQALFENGGCEHNSLWHLQVAAGQLNKHFEHERNGKPLTKKESVCVPGQYVAGRLKHRPEGSRALCICTAVDRFGRPTRVQMSPGGRIVKASVAVKWMPLNGKAANLDYAFEAGGHFATWQQLMHAKKAKNFRKIHVQRFPDPPVVEWGGQDLRKEKTGATETPLQAPPPPNS